jgi:predicted nucleic acid-binding protein
MLESRTVHVVPQTTASFAAGLSLYDARPDKGYSLTDCISMETMRHEGITDVLTNDAHFDQEGFRAIFR